MDRAPKDLVSLNDVIAAELGQAADPLWITGVSQANGTWAALVPLSKSATALVSGGSAKPHAALIPGRFDDLAVDPAGLIHLLRQVRSRGGSNTVSIVDAGASVIETYNLPSGGESARHFLSGPAVVWKMSDPLVTARPFVPILNFGRQEDAKEPLGVFVGSLGSGDGGYFTFDDLSEVVTLHGPDGSVPRSYTATEALTSAYRAIGASVEKAPAGSDVTRVIWASATSHGRLYICLSGLPVSGPANIAVLNVNDGVIEKVIRAELPSFESDIAPNNRTGTMMPGMGMAEDQLIIADQSKGLLVIYPK